MSAVAAPADRRFRRARVKPARRKRNWRALVASVTTCGIGALVIAYGLYRGSGSGAAPGLLRVDHITVRGNDRLS